MYQHINQSINQFVNSEAYSEPCQISKIVRFAKIVNSFQSLTIFAKRSILDVSQGSEYSSETEITKWNN